MATVLVVGASGVIGRALVPLLLDAGIRVVGTSRSKTGCAAIEDLEATSAELDIYDAAAVDRVRDQVRPDVVICQVTDLPDDAGDLASRREGNARIRREAIPQLIQAVRRRSDARILVQSVSWDVPGEGGDAVRAMERSTLEAGGVVLRYGQFYGPATFHDEPPAGPHVTPAEAAAQTLALLDAPSGIAEIAQ